MNSLDAIIKATEYVDAHIMPPKNEKGYPNDADTRLRHIMRVAEFLTGDSDSE
jgi:hypothetical protein